VAVRTWTLKIRGDEKDAIRAADKVENRFKSLDINKGLSAKMDKLRTKFGSFADGMAKTGQKLAKGIALGALGGVVALGAGIVSTFKAASESLKIGRQTTQVIKTMGAGSWTSAKQIGALATNLSNLTGVDDELIQQGANLLLTFGKVRNEVGKGNKIFDRTVVVANDMSVALGQDMKSSSIQLGKALNDPIKGVSALQRVGVSFNQSQKDQIKTLVESGKTLQAQKLILKEVEAQFGGTAAAVATPWDRLKVTLGNIQEDIGARFIPVINKVATFFADRLPGAIDKAKMVFNVFVDAFRRGDVTSDGLVGVAERLGVAVRGAWPHVQRMASTVADWGRTIGAFFKRNPKVLFASLAAVIGTLLVGSVVALGAALVAVISPFLLVVVAIAGIAGAVTYAYTRWSWFRNAVDDVVAWFKRTAWPALQSFATDVQEAFAKLSSWVQANWPKVQAAVGFVVAWITGTAWPAIQRFVDLVQVSFADLVAWVRRTWPQISEAIGHVLVVIKVAVGLFVVTAMFLWRTFGDTILAHAKRVWNAIWTVISGLLMVIRGIITTVLALINGDWGRAWEGIKTMVAGIWRAIYGVVELGIAGVRLTLQLGIDAIKVVWSAAWGVIKSVASRAWDGIVSGITHGVNAVIHVINAFIRGINAVTGLIGIPAIPTIATVGGPGQSGGGAAGPAGGGGSSLRRERGGKITNGPEYLVGEGNRRYPEAVIATDPKYRKRNLGLLNWAANRMGVGGQPQGLQFGGIMNAVGNVGDFVTGIPGRVRDAGVSAVVNPLRNVAKSALNHVPVPFLRDLAKGWVDKVSNWIKGKADEADSASRNTGYTGGGGVERWRATALSALRMTGSPATWIGSLLRRMNQESGGNPNAVNNWDSNAKRGDPSGGLMQNIRSAYASRVSGFPSLRGTSFLHPLGSIVASIIYANGRYGTAPRGWDRAGGYRNGGIVDRPGPTHPGEMVLRPGDQRQLLKVVRSRTPQGATSLSWSGNLIVQANTPAEGRAAAKAFLSVLEERQILTDARIA